MEQNLRCDISIGPNLQEAPQQLRNLPGKVYVPCFNEMACEHWPQQSMPNMQNGELNVKISSSIGIKRK